MEYWNINKKHWVDELDRNKSLIVEKHEFQSQDEFIIQTFPAFLVFVNSNTETQLIVFKQILIKE